MRLFAISLLAVVLLPLASAQSGADGVSWDPSDPCTGPLSSSSKCHHGSTCHKGPADYGDFLSPYADTIPFLAVTSDDHFEHCECSPNMHCSGGDCELETEGHTGINCEHRYEICSPKHSGFACFHGAKCVKIKHDEDHKYACDCSTAKWDGKHEHFVGEQCEYGGPKDIEEGNLEFCPSAELEELSDEWFCLNGGRCRDSK